MERTLNIRIPDDLKRAVDTAAWKEHLSTSEWVRKALEERLAATQAA